VTRRSLRLDRLPGYPLAGIPEAKRRLLAAGRDVIDLGAGESIAPPPPEAVDELRAALDDPRMSHYGFQLGYVPFREAAAAYMARRFGVELDPLAEILPLIGSKDGLAHLALAVTDPGDLVVVPEPGYAAYLGAAVAAGAGVLRAPLEADTGFLVELDAIPEEDLARVRLVYLNYPNNPTAAIAPRDYLERTIAVCRRRGIVLAYDNPYVDLTFDGYVAPSILEVPGAREVALEFHSMSKSFSMTGWRVGWVAGRRELVGALSTLKSYLDTGPLLLVQRASVPVLEHAESIVKPLAAEFERRRDAAVLALSAAGLHSPTPKATPYLWVRLPPGVESRPFALRLLEEEAVVVLPGASFGEAGEGFVRIALAEPVERLTEAAGRIGRMLATAV